MINHQLLQKQLKRINLSEIILPENLEDWKSFLFRINQTYLENDQDRYIIERSLEISSTEMQELFSYFEEAQKMAHMGSWIYNFKNNKFIWSNEMYNLFNRETILGPLSVQELLLVTHSDDQHFLDLAFERLFQSGIDINLDFRTIINGKDQWMNIKGRLLSKNEAGGPEVLEGTVTDITERKVSEKKMLALNEQLISAARRAGMAEVASSTLHNIGNVLNSLNVNCAILLEKLANSKISKIKKVVELIDVHKKDLGSFFESDPKGKYVPEYLTGLATCWDEEQKNYTQYLLAMNEHIQHIKNIVSRQQSLSGAIGVIQRVGLNAVIDDAISIVIPEQQKVVIDIKKDFMPLSKVLVDSVVLLQVLVNLIRNAKESLEASNKKENKQMIIKLTRENPTMVSISVEDNGLGISPENVKKIFTYRFTTKEFGSGIGLHTSHLAARGMGGNLEAINLGKDKGAIFVLTFPYKV